MSRSNRPIRTTISEPRLADLIGGDPLGLADHLETFEAMVSSRSEVAPVKRESKPIGKKYYRKTRSKTVSAMGHTYRPTDRVDRNTGRIIWQRVN